MVICRSLLAGDSERNLSAWILNRLPVRQAQGPEHIEGLAGSYIQTVTRLALTTRPRIVAPET
jgi:hypothetical protein